MSEYDNYVQALRSLMRPNPTPEHVAIYYAISLGRAITAASVSDDTLRITFAGGGTLRIWDDGQSCCEDRYMTTDDDLPSFAGAKIVGFDATETSCVDDEYGDPHEQMFVRLHTDRGTITLVTHNEHNGYYGGFNVESTWEQTDGADA